MTATALAASTEGRPATLDCDLDDDDSFDHHLICAERSTCAFTSAAELDAAGVLPEFYTSGDRTERLWLAEFEQANLQLSATAVELALDRYRTDRALDLRNSTERSARVHQLGAAAAQCKVCLRPDRIGVSRVAAGPATDDEDDSGRTAVPLTTLDGTPIAGAVVRRARPRRLASITRLPGFRPYPQFIANYVDPQTGKSRRCVACPECQTVIRQEVERRIAATTLGDTGQTLSDRVADYLDGAR